MKNGLRKNVRNTLLVGWLAQAGVNVYLAKRKCNHTEILERTEALVDSELESIARFLDLKEIPQVTVLSEHSSYVGGGLDVVGTTKFRDGKCLGIEIYYENIYRKSLTKEKFAKCVVETLAHELTHAKQIELGTFKSSDYVGVLDGPSAISKMVRYYRQPSEVEARKFGKLYKKHYLANR